MEIRNPAEVERREVQALTDVAATLRYHAARLPTSSRWRAEMNQLHQEMAQDLAQRRGKRGLRRLAIVDR